MSKLSALMVMGKIKKFKKRMDYTEEGGAVLMGISKPVIKLTEALTPRLFYNAVRQAKNCVDGGVYGNHR